MTAKMKIKYILPAVLAGLLAACTPSPENVGESEALPLYIPIM